MHPTDSAFLSGYGMVDLSDSLGVPDFLQFLLAESPDKQASFVFKRISVNQVCAIKGKSFEVHVLGSWLIDAGLKHRGEICSC